MRAPALAGLATVGGARGATGQTKIRARGTKNEPTSGPASPLTIPQFHPAQVEPGSVGNSYHEHALARIVQRLRVLRHGRDMRLHHLKDEEVVLVDEHVVIQPAFEARMALPDQRRSNVMSFGRQAEGRELVDLPPRGVADPDDLVGQYGRGQIDHAFAAIADHPEAVIRIPGEGLGLDSCAVAKRVGWCAMSRGGRPWRELLVI